MALAICPGQTGRPPKATLQDEKKTMTVIDFQTSCKPGRSKGGSECQGMVIDLTQRRKRTCEDALPTRRQLGGLRLTLLPGECSTGLLSRARHVSGVREIAVRHCLKPKTKAPADG